MLRHKSTVYLYSQCHKQFYFHVFFPLQCNGTFYQTSNSTGTLNNTPSRSALLLEQYRARKSLRASSSNQAFPPIFSTEKKADLRKPKKAKLSKKTLDKEIKLPALHEDKGWRKCKKETRRKSRK